MLTADSVFINGKVVTVDKNFNIKESIAVKDGWVIDVGENSDIKKYIGTDTRVIDLQGKLILPGAHDSHAHGSVFGATRLQFDCSFPNVHNVETLQAAVAEAVKVKPKNAWVRGAGLYAENFDELQVEKSRRITRLDIDKVSPDHPVWILNWSGHGILVNTKALEITGINKDTPDPKEGLMPRFSDGEPTGEFYEAGAMPIINRHIPLWSDEEIYKAIRIFQEILNRNGYTSYTESTLGPASNDRDAGAPGERTIGIYKKLKDDGNLTARVSIGYYTGKDGIQSSEEMRKGLENIKSTAMDDPNWLKMDMAKIFCDGIHLFHTAWMMEDYIDAPGNHGRSCFPGETDAEQAEELHRIIKIAHEKGFQVGIHAIGDRAVKESLDGIIKAMQNSPGENLRHYIIHADSFATDENAAEAAKFGIGFSVQPGLAPNLFEASIECVGEKAERIFGLKNFIDAGVNVAGGADALFGEYCNWRQAVQSAVTRKSAITGKVYSPELAISVEEGIRLFTINAAIQERAENVRGSIEIGKVADFQVLDQDILNIDPEEIGNTQVLMTMLDGKIIYQDEHFQY